jgi:hypothetical protein
LQQVQDVVLAHHRLIEARQAYLRRQHHKSQVPAQENPGI